MADQIKLITRTDIAVYRQISKTVNMEILDQQIYDAQFMDLQKLLGVEFYEDFITNRYDGGKYTTLFEGGSYTYEDNTYSNVGLKIVLVHYAYARYIRFGSHVDTPFSLVNKTNANSERVSESEKKAIYKNNQQIAFNYWENVKRFLDRNYEDYPLWKTGCQPQYTKFRINKIV